MNPRQARSIALRVTLDLNLRPRLTTTEVTALLNGDTIVGCHPLVRYPEELHAPIESRILQEAEDG